MTVVLALVGCGKDELVSERTETPVPMTFGVYAKQPHQPETKADGSYVASGTFLPSNSYFGVFAFLQEGVIGGAAGAWAADTWTPGFMFAQAVHFSGAEYDYSPLQYWPSNEENTISFWAYYPYGAYAAGNTGALKLYADDACSETYTTFSEGLPRVKYTVDTAPAAQQDLMFDSFANTDMTHDSCTPTPGTVPLSFRHALCAVEFSFEMPSGSGTPGVDYTFSFNSLTLNDIQMTGLCLDPAASPIVWSGWSGAEDLTTTVYDSVNERSETFLLLPQTLTDDLTLDFDVVLKYPSADDPTNRAADLEYPFHATGLKLNAATDGPAAWAAGTRYLYKLKLSLEKIEFSASVSSWDAATNISIP